MNGNNEISANQKGNENKRLEMLNKSWYFRAANSL